MITYQDIAKASSTIITTNIKGKDYAEVNQRIKAFRMVYPEGFIVTEIVSNENGVIVMRATVGTYNEKGEPMTLGVGTAFEREESSYINKTSYVENCETSCVGRALGMCGFGIDTSVCSAEELTNAVNNQTVRKASPKQVEVLAQMYTGDNLTKLLTKNGVSCLQELPMDKASDLISRMKERAR